MTSTIVEFIFDSDFEDGGSGAESSPEPEPDSTNESSARQSSPEPTTAPKDSRKIQINETAARHSGRLSDPGYKSFACNMCQESFSFKFELLLHKMSHYETPKRTRMPSAAARWKMKFKKHRPLNKSNIGKMKLSMRNAKGESLIRKKPEEKLDDPRLLTPLDQGWARLVVYRPNTTKPVCDVYYRSPEGKKFRSVNELLAKGKFRNGLSLANFTFSRRPLDMKHANEIIRPAGSSLKMAESFPSSQTKKDAPLTNPISQSKVPSETGRSENGRRVVQPQTSISVPKSPIKKEVVTKSKSTPPSKAPSNFHSNESQSQTDDDGKFILPLIEGWVRLVVRRPKSQAYDVYYLNSEGRKFRSLSDLRHEKFSKGVTLENFSFKRRPLSLKHPRQIVRTAGSKSRKAVSLSAKPVRREDVPEIKATPPPSSKSENTTAGRETLSRFKRSPIATRKIRTPNLKLFDDQSESPSKTKRCPLTGPKNETTDHEAPKTARKPSIMNHKPGTSNGENDLGDQKFLLPLSQGWSRLVVFRRSLPKMCDIYYLDPAGRKFRSMKELGRAVSTNGKRGGLSPENFTFARRVLDLDHPKQITKRSGDQPVGRRKKNSPPPPSPLRPLTSLVPKSSRRAPVKSRIRHTNDPKLNFLSQLDLDSKDLQPRVVLEDIMFKKLPNPEEPVDGYRDTESGDDDEGAALSRSNSPQPDGDEGAATSKSNSPPSDDTEVPACASEPALPETVPDERENDVSNSEDQKPISSQCESETEVVDLDVHVDHTCQHCWLEFDTMHDLLSHQRGHVAEGWILNKPSINRPVRADFICYHCGFQCKTKMELLAHMTKHRKKSKTHPYECGTCGYRARDVSRLKFHKLIHSEYRPFECYECGRKMKRKADLKRHIVAIHLRTKSFACSKCEYRGSQKSYLDLHMDHEHLSGRKYKCENCNHRAKSLTHLRVHEMVHSGVKRFPCQECGYGSNFLSDLRYHMSVHTGWKPYQCSLCDYKCCNGKYLKAHMRVHTGEKPFECQLCHKSFSHRSTLRKHMDGHYRVYRYTCAFCPYKTQHQTSINYHQKLHEGERDHDCPHCPKSFIDIHSLNLHMRVHTGEKPIKCEVCNSRFAFRASWKSHLRKCDPEHPSLKSKRTFIEPLTRKEATKAIMKAAALKPRSHERTILDFINRNQVKYDTDESHHSDNKDKPDTDDSRRISKGNQVLSDGDDSADKPESDRDTESVTLIEKAPESPCVISDSDADDTPAASSRKASATISADKTPTPCKPPKPLLTMSDLPGRANNDIGSGEAVIRESDKICHAGVLESNDIP